jgi:predicted PurR-regulated permease PerM
MVSDTPPSSADMFYTRTFVLGALGLLAYLLYQILQPFFVPLAWALFIAFLLYPLQLRLSAKLKGRTSLSASLLTLATFFMLVGPLTALGAAFGAQVADLLRWAQQFAADHPASELSDLSSVPVVGSALDWAQETTGVSLEQIEAWAIQAARTVLQFLASLGREIFVGALGTVVGFLMMMFILFFAIRDGGHMFDIVRALIPAKDANKTRLFNHLAAVTRAIVFGTGVTALTQGALIAIGFAIAGLPSPIVFGVLAALVALVPLAGTPVVWVPAVIVLMLQQRWVAAIFLLLWGLMVSTMDNFLRPILVSGRARVDTLTVFIGVLGGISAFGPIGILLGPLVLALIIALARFTLEVREVETTNQ